VAKRGGVVYDVEHVKTFKGARPFPSNLAAFAFKCRRTCAVEAHRAVHKMKVRTFAPLSEDFKPPKLLHRDVQLQEMLKYTLGTGIPENLWLEGGKGLGKTLTCKCFADEVEARGAGKVLFVQCERSMRRALESTCSRYGLPVWSGRASPSTVALAANKAYGNAALLTFIVEEPENVDLDNLRSFIHVLYNTLLEVRGRLRFNICFTSKLLYSVAERELEGERDSRLALKPITFNPYDATQIVDILKQRLNLMFDKPLEAYEEEALIIIAQHVRRIGSDIREALKITKVAVELAEDRLTHEVAEKAVEWSKKKWWLDQLLQLPEHQAFLLYLAAENALSNAECAVLQADVVDKYMLKCQNMGVDALGRRTIYNLLSDLAGKGFYKTQQIHVFGKPVKLIFHRGDAERIVEAGRELKWKDMLT